MKSLLTATIALFLFAALGYAGDVKHVDAKEAIALMEGDQEPRVVDVRTAEEYAEGHLAGALNIDFKKPDFAGRLGKLDRDQPYLVHCRSGRRSSQSLAVFEKLGFKNIIHLNGGIQAWKKAGGSIEK